MPLNIKGMKDHFLVFAAFLMILCAAIQGGCAPRSFYDPTGKRLFSDGRAAPPPSAEGDAAPAAAARLSSGPAADTRETVVRGNDQRSTRVVPAVEPNAVPEWEPRDIILGPPQYVASPGAEVIFVAGVRDHGGYLRTNQPVEWNISKESVGHFVRLEGRQWRNLMVGDFTLPRIESDTHAVSTTSRTEQVLDRGTPRTDDDIRVLRGQTWISVTSPREGITWVTVSAKNIKDWEKRTQTARVFWVDAVFKLPESPRVIDFGGRYTMITSLKRGSDGRPLANWRVRYEIPGGSTAVFPDGNKMLEVLTDAQGEARLDILQSISRQEDTDVSVQIIRPAEAGTAFSQPVVVQQGKVRYRWMPNTLAVQKSLPPRANVGETVMGTISITNVTEQPLTNIRVSEMLADGFSLVESMPKAVPAVDGASWILETLGPRETHVIQTTYRVQSPGTYASCARATVEKLGNQLVVESCATVFAGDPNAVHTPGAPAGGNDPETRDPFMTPGGGAPALLPLPPPPMTDGPSEISPGTSPEAGRTYEGASGTRDAGLSSGAGTGGGAGSVPAGSGGLFPGTASEKEAPGGHAAANAITASGVPRAPVHPEEPADALIGLDIITDAYVRLEEDLQVRLAVQNRAGKPLEKLSIRVATSQGLDNKKGPDKTRLERALGNMEPGKRMLLGLPLKAIIAGDQSISVTLYDESREIMYTRGVTVRVLAPGESVPGLSGFRETAATGATGDAVRGATGDAARGTGGDTGADPRIPGGETDASAAASSGTVPGERPESRLNLRVEGPAQVKQGEKVLFSIWVNNPTAVAFPDLKVQLKTAPEVMLYRSTEKLQRPSGVPAFWMCDLRPSGTYHYRAEYLCQTPAERVQNEVSLILDGRELAVKTFSFQVIADPVQFPPAPPPLFAPPLSSPPVSPPPVSAPPVSTPPASAPPASTLPSDMPPLLGLPPLSSAPGASGTEEIGDGLPSAISPTSPGRSPAAASGPYETSLAPAAMPRAAVIPEISEHTTVGDVLGERQSPGNTGEDKKMSPEKNTGVKAEADAAGSGADLETPPLSLEIRASAEVAYLGQPFYYTLTMTNTTAEPIRKVLLLTALPPDSLAIQRDGIQKPESVTVESVHDGLIQFSVIPELAAGETMQFKIPVRPLREERVEISVRAVAAGIPMMSEMKETQIRNAAAEE